MPVLAAALPAITAVSGLAGAGLSAVGAVEGGKATAANDKYQAAVASYNAQIADQNATWAIQSGETQAANQGLKTRATVGAEKAAEGANGVDVNSGSAANVRAGTQSMGLLDAMTIRSNASRSAYGYQVQATNDTAQSQLDTSAAGQAVTAGDIAGGAGLLSGASTVAGKYAGYLQTSGGGSNPTAPAMAPSNGTWDL